MLAGAVLCLLGMNEIAFVQPERRRQEQAEREANAALAGTSPRELAGGVTLMPDGRLIRK